MLHHPLIETRPLPGLLWEKARREWPFFTHVIFTSPRTVAYWDCWEGVEDKELLAIGSGTARLLPRCKVAKEATQEGVVALLDTIGTDSYVFLPASVLARGVILQFLERKGVRYLSLSLYETVTRVPEEKISLQDIGEVVFTSPSTVRAFREVYGPLPKHCRAIAWGPITKQALERYMV